MARTLDEILRNEKPEVVEKAIAKASDILLDIHLTELRELVEKTQAEMARAMNIKQPTIAAMEKQGHDMKLSSLKRYVEAAGCKLRLNIELPDGSSHGFSI